MKYFSMFSGIGGFEIGIQNAVESYRQAQQADADTGHSANNQSNPLQKWGQSATCIGYSEIDKYAIKVYERRFNGEMLEGSPDRGSKEDPSADKKQGFQSEKGKGSGAETRQSSGDDRNEPHQRQFNSGGHTNYGDATKIKPRELPDFDLLVGGFPCQAFSIAGKRKGFEDTRGTLFFDIARILSEKRPRHLVLENVKGLLSHDRGKTFQTILGVLSDIGYRVEWQILNSKDFGVPQNRERIFIVGHLREECGRKIFPISGNSSEDIKRLGHMPGYRRYNQTYYADGSVEAMDTSGGGGHQPCVGIDLSSKKAVTTKQSRAIQARYHKGYSKRTAETTGVLESMRIRRLTPKECERLQGFPDDWTKEGSEECHKTDCERCGLLWEMGGDYVHMNKEEISDTQRYKMCGNAVTVNVVEAVITKLLGVK